MRRLIAFTVLLISSLAAQSQDRPFCKLQGSIFISETKQGSDYFIYVEESEAFADMLIFEEENKLYADEPGVWFFVEKKGLADYILYFTQDKSEADFTIYYTDSPTFAGCQ